MIQQNIASCQILEQHQRLCVIHQDLFRMSIPCEQTISLQDTRAQTRCPYTSSIERHPNVTTEMNHPTTYNRVSLTRR